MTYDEIKDGDVLEFQDFWHSGILSWRTGIVKTGEFGKIICFRDQETRVIFPHRMYNVKKTTSLLNAFSYHK